MRRRLLVVSSILISALLLALMLPLLSAYAADRTEDLFSKRLADVTRFSVLASPALEGGDFESLESDLTRYEEVHGAAVVVVDANGDQIAASESDIGLDTSAEVGALTRALSGTGTPPPRTAWPWRDEPLIIASPVGRDAQILGAVVMIAPTDSVRDDVTVRLAWFGLAALVVVTAVAGAVALPLVGWVIRPVRDLDEAAQRFGSGDLSTRVPASVGPPELRHLASSFNSMADSVAMSQSQQRDLVADASHQLGNPLTALRLRIELLGSGATPDQEQPIDEALEEADRLSGIVESLIELTRVGAHDPDPQPADVAEQVRHRCELWAPLYDGRLEVVTPEVAWARTTPGLIDLILDALLDNAAKFAPDSQVDVDLAALDHSWRLVVRDHGAGVDAGDVAKLGSRFFRGRAHQNVAGSGLGLAIVQARIIALGGEFEVAAADPGLRVGVTFPAATDPAPGRTGVPRGAGRADR